MAHRRTSPRRSGDSESAGKNIWTSPGPTLKKAKNKRGSIFNCLIFIKVLRELSKHTTYVSVLSVLPDSLSLSHCTVQYINLHTVQNISLY